MSSIQNRTPIALTCSECGVGVYIAEPFTVPCWECTECGHRIASCDVELESGETLTTDDTGALAYLPADDPEPTDY